ncbi:MAG: UbiA family prenyltransferase [Desulfuromonadaceae bacterium]|nr:UbiA family prenyltransferase [Desulfuromonadaceae bacterium]MDD2855989.1 UbiA family prenyltransferase [Desulfuromonadaceae bacterium]
MSLFKAYLALFRVSNLPTVWSNVLAAFLVSGETFSWIVAALLIMAMSLFYSAGMVLNDICDVEFDAVQKKSRPLSSGIITLLGAKMVLTLLFILGFAILLFLPNPLLAVVAGIVLFGLIVFYDKYHKGNPTSVFLMAGCRLMVYMVVATAVSGTVNKVVLTVALCQFAYIIFLSCVARYENAWQHTISFPLIPLLLAAICLVDGLSVSLALKSPIWFVGGFAGFTMTLAAQKYVRGD